MAEISKREQKKLLAKQTIMETAIEQFVQRGFQATSIADIMKAANMGLGTFYNYFDSKDQLLHYLLDNLYDMVCEHHFLCAAILLDIVHDTA